MRQICVPAAVRKLVQWCRISGDTPELNIVHKSASCAHNWGISEIRLIPLFWFSQIIVITSEIRCKHSCNFSRSLTSEADMVKPVAINEYNNPPQAMLQYLIVVHSKSERNLVMFPPLDEIVEIAMRFVLFFHWDLITRAPPSRQFNVAGSLVPRWRAAAGIQKPNPVPTSPTCSCSSAFRE